MRSNDLNGNSLSDRPRQSPRDANDGNGLQAVVTPDPDGSFASRVVDAESNVFLTLQGYRTMELPETIDAELLKSLRLVLQ